MAPSNSEATAALDDTLTSSATTLERLAITEKRLRDRGTETGDLRARIRSLSDRAQSGLSTRRTVTPTSWAALAFRLQLREAETGVWFLTVTMAAEQPEELEVDFRSILPDEDVTFALELLAEAVAALRAAQRVPA